MKSASYSLLAALALLLTASCSQNPPATEQAGTTTAADSAAVPAPVTADSVATAATTPKTETPAAAAPAPAAVQPVRVAFHFKTGPANGPSGPSTSAHLVLAGGKTQDIDLGQFTGKPDVVTKEKAKLASFPSGMLMGFRCYDPGSGTSQDLAVMNVGGRQLRIVQRHLDEGAEKIPEFQTSRELDLPANAIVEVGAAVKK